MKKRRWKWIGLALLKPRFTIPLAILFAVLAGVLSYREYQVAGLPDIGDPFDVEAFGTVDIPDEENAAIEYRAAEAMVKELPYRHKDNLDATLKEGWAVASPEVKKWLEDNRPALEIWLKGTQKPHALFCQPKDMFYDSMMSVINHGSLSDLGRVEAVRLESELDLINAWNMHRAVIRHSHHLTMYGCAIDRTVGNAFFAFTTKGIVRWSNHSQVSSPMLLQAIQQLQSDFQMTPPLSRTLKIEYLFDKNTQHKNDGWREVLTARKLVRETLMMEQDEPLSELELFLKNEPELSWRVTQLAYQNWLLEIDRPRHKFSPRQPGELNLFVTTAGGHTNSFPPEKIEQFYQRSLLATESLRFPGFIFSHFRCKAREGVVLVLLAAQLYYREHNHFPEQVTELLDGYLDEIPPDTMSNVEEPIKYRRLSNDRCVIWSVWENRVNDGGNTDSNWNDPDMDFGFEIGPAGWKGNP